MRSRKHISAAFGAFAAALALTAPASGALLTTQDRVLLSEMNRARHARGLGPLRLDPALQRAARSHSLSMLRRGAFSHGSFAARMARFGARGPVLGENLAWGVGTRARARTIVRMWLRSPGHRRNLLRPGFRRVGVASATGRFAGYAGARLVTADFAGR